MKRTAFKGRLAKVIARASRNCGVALEVFWLLTPSELHEIELQAREEFESREELQERRTARLMATAVNCHPNKKKGSKNFTEEDFLPERLKRKHRNGNRASERSLLDKIFWIDQNLRAQLATKRVVKK